MGRDGLWASGLVLLPQMQPLQCGKGFAEEPVFLRPLAFVPLGLGAVRGSNRNVAIRSSGNLVAEVKVRPYHLSENVADTLVFGRPLPREQ